MTVEGNPPLNFIIADDGGFGGSHWGKKRDSADQPEGPWGRGGGDRGRGRGIGRGSRGRGEPDRASNADRREKRDKPVPKSVDQMPKLEASRGKVLNVCPRLPGTTPLLSH